MSGLRGDMKITPALQRRLEKAAREAAQKSYVSITSLKLFDFIR